MDLVEIRKKAKSRKKKAGTAARKKKAAPVQDVSTEAVHEAPESDAAVNEVATGEAKLDRSRPSGGEPVEPTQEVEGTRKLEEKEATVDSHTVVEKRVTDSLDGLKDVLMSQHEEKEEEAEEEQLQLLTFMLGGEEYALNIMDIKEIIRPKEPTEVPKTPEYIMGIISLRGTIIPIFNVNSRLGLLQPERTPQNRVVVVKSQEHLFGLLVDSVVQVLDIAISKIDPPPEILGGVEGEFLRGVGKLGDRLIILLNLSRILLMDEHETGQDLELSAGK